MTTAADPTDRFVTRPMTAADVDLAVDWAAAEGWNPGLDDAPVFRAVDPDGFILGVLDGLPVASISVVRYDDGFAFLGFYIVHPDFRGRGYGWRTWQAGMAHAGERLVGLDGVVDQQDNYRKSGFAFAWRNLRMGGTVSVDRQWSPPETVRPVTTEDLAALSALDRRVFPAERPGFLAAWTGQAGHVALGVRQGGRLLGFGVLRPCRTGFKLGPLVAEQADVAETLLRSLAQHADGAPLFLDVPQPNPAASALAARHGLTPVFETARMYTGPAPTIAMDTLFGVTSFELG